ncbi:MAG: Ni/Fe-hydrogenase, b-type cytochrome subunit [Desulforhopalus sp.]
MATYERHYCWSILLRLFHWMFALSIVFLAATGLYINNPWTNTMIEGSASFPMATMRYIHYIAAYVFASAVIIRLFLYFFGNAQERVWDILPVTRRNINNLKMTLLQYSYISDRHDDRLGHNILAGILYLLTFFAAVFMICSGFFLLYPENSFWAGWGVTLFGSQQVARYLHHVLMWWFIIFAVIHIYFCIWNDCQKPEGLISSIFTGDKFKHSA